MKKKIIIVFNIIAIIITSISFADEIDLTEENTEKNTYSHINIEEEKAKKVSVNARAAIVIDRKSKKIIYEKNAYEKRPMASTTKIMTLLLGIENGNLDEEIIVDKKAATVGGSTLNLKTGDKILFKDLLIGMMLRSGNDAATQVALTISGSVSEFANLMNKKAKELHLYSTNFVTPHGLDDDNHYTTAYELAILTDYALENELFSKIVNTKQTSIIINGKTVNVSNTNDLLGVTSGLCGVKTGYTSKAGRCLVSFIKRNNLDAICIVMGTDTKNLRNTDTLKLIDFTYSNYEEIDFKNIIEQALIKWKENNIIQIIKGKEKSIAIMCNYNNCNLNYPLIEEEKKMINIKINIDKIVKAPIIKGETIGNIEVMIEEKVILSVPIIINNSIEKKNVFDYLQEILLSLK